MGYILRNSLHFCKISGCFIFLDLGSDRYFMLDGEAAGYFDHFVHGEASDRDHRWLASRGILTQSCSTPRHQSVEAPAPCRSALDLNLPQPTLRQTTRAVAAVLGFRNRLKRHPLETVLAQHAKRRPANGSTDRTTCLAVAAAFNRSKRYVSANETCLPRSLAMTHILFGLGIDAKMLFGVTLPFSAHCWVQVGDMVLTDPIHRVLGFTPILVK